MKFVFKDFLHLFSEFTLNYLIRFLNYTFSLKTEKQFVEKTLNFLELYYNLFETESENIRFDVETLLL